MWFENENLVMGTAIRCGACGSVFFSVPCDLTVNATLRGDVPPQTRAPVSVWKHCKEGKISYYCMVLSVSNW